MGTISVILLIGVLGAGVYFFVKKSKESKKEPQKPTNYNSIKTTKVTKKTKVSKEFDTSSLDEKK